MDIFEAVQIANDAAEEKPVPRSLIGRACAKLVEAYRDLLFDVQKAPQQPVATGLEGRWVNGYFIPDMNVTPPEPLPFRIEKAGGEVYILPR